MQAAQTLDQRVTPLFAELERIKKDNEIMRDALKESKIDLEFAELLQRDVDELSQLLYEAQKSLASTKEENNRLAIAPRRQAAQIPEKDIRIRELEGLVEKQEKKVLHSTSASQRRNSFLHQIKLQGTKLKALSRKPSLLSSLFKIQMRRYRLSNLQLMWYAFLLRLIFWFSLTAGMIRCAERGVYIYPSERLQLNDTRHGMQQARQLLDGMVVYIPGETSGEIEGLVSFIMYNCMHADYNRESRLLTVVELATFW